MNYYLDTEFNGFGRQLLSMALVREDGESLYAVLPAPAEPDPWVAQNVLPLMLGVPRAVRVCHCTADELPAYIQWFLEGDKAPRIISDWPDDIRYFCQAVITGPGQMISVPSLTFEVRRVDAYPTTLPDAVQHNAWWDAMALRHLFTKEQ